MTFRTSCHNQTLEHQNTGWFPQKAPWRSRSRLTNAESTLEEKSGLFFLKYRVICLECFKIKDNKSRQNSILHPTVEFRTAIIEARLLTISVTCLLSILLQYKIHINIKSEIFERTGAECLYSTFIGSVQVSLLTL